MTLELFTIIALLFVLIVATIERITTQKLINLQRELLTADDSVIVSLRNVVAVQEDELRILEAQKSKGEQ